MTYIIILNKLYIKQSVKTQLHYFRRFDFKRIANTHFRRW